MNISRSCRGGEECHPSGALGVLLTRCLDIHRSERGDPQNTFAKHDALQKGDSQMASNSLTALITGGTSGIGRAAAKKLAALGIHALVVGRNAKRGEETLAEIRASGGKADFISSDLGNASSAREVA